MKRGDFFRVKRASKEDPKDFRIYLIVSRQEFIDTNFSTVVCAPVYTNYHGIATQVEVGVEEGLKHNSAVDTDALISVSKSKLTNYISHLSDFKMEKVNEALRVALAIE